MRILKTNANGNNKKIVHLFSILLILSVLLFVPTVFAADSENTTKQCKLTAECNQGYCENGICVLPTVIENYKSIGRCAFTSDCKQGFCVKGQCLLLERQEFQIITLGAKSGCAGIIENCTGIWCYFCNVTWVFLIVGAGVAAWASRKRGRILPILMAIIPLAFGYLLLPLLGFILAMVEIIILLVVKKEKVKISEAQPVKAEIQLPKPQKVPQAESKTESTDIKIKALEDTLQIKDKISSTGISSIKKSIKKNNNKPKD
jgi:hypothetical protein